MKDPGGSLRWIVALLQGCGVPFQVTGGLAAQVYGSDRELVDIDLDVPEEAFPTILPAVKDHVVFGPSRYQDEHWDLLLMTLDYGGQPIDLGGAYSAKLFDCRSRQWVDLKSDLSRAVVAELFGLKVPVISRQELLEYKEALGREVDRADVRAILAQPNPPGDSAR